MAWAASPVGRLEDEVAKVAEVPTTRAGLLLALGPLADGTAPEIRQGVARVYVTLPLDPRGPITRPTIDAARELVALLRAEPEPIWNPPPDTGP
jgi:hypothetical protein